MKKIDNKSMKIAFVSDAIYPYNKGGKEKRIYEISTRLVKRGYDVHIYCMKWWRGKENKRIENGVHLDAISRYYPLYSGKRRSIKQAVMFAFACFKLIKEDFDVIDVDHMPHLVLFPIKIVTILKRKKLIVTWNEVWGRKYWIDYMGILGNIAYIFEKLSVLMPDQIISISKHTTEKLIKELKINKPIQTIPVGVDLNKIKNIPASDIKSDIIFAGRLLTHKNIDMLIRSIDLLRKKDPKIKCLIIGNGPEKKRLEKMTMSLGLSENVLFLDFLKNHEELYSLMKSSKVFILPSTREGFGIVALEANACGIPVITINHKDNAAKDLINGENGIVCKLDEKDIATTLRKLLKNKISPKVSVNLAKTYNWNNITKQIENTYTL